MDNLHGIDWGCEAEEDLGDSERRRLNRRGALQCEDPGDDDGGSWQEGECGGRARDVGCVQHIWLVPVRCEHAVFSMLSVSRNYLLGRLLN